MQRSSQCILQPQPTGLDGLVSYQDTLWRGSYPSAEKQSVYSTDSPSRLGIIIYCILIRNWRTTTLGYINKTLFIFSWSQNFCGVKERQTDRGRQRQTAILTHNFFFSWPYYAVLSSRPYVFSSDETYSTGSHLEAAWPLAATVLYLPTRLHCKLALT